MPLTPTALCAALALGAIAAGCTPANELKGSMGTLTSLDFSEVVVTLSTASKTSPSQLVVSYRNPHDAGAYSVPFELAVNVTGLPPLTPSNPPIDLAALQPPDGGIPVATTSRSVPNDTRTFPPIDSGHLWIDQAIQVGQQGAGHFFLVYGFPNDGSLGEGYTVEGRFQAVVSP